MDHKVKFKCLKALVAIIPDRLDIVINVTVDRSKY